MKWINVEDRMPKFMEWILAYCVSGAQEVVRYDHVMDDWDSQTPNRAYMKEYVTHWMPLPEPPKGEQDGD